MTARLRCACRATHVTQEEMLAMLPPTAAALKDLTVSHGLSGRDGGFDDGGGDAGSKARPGAGSGGSGGSAAPGSGGDSAASAASQGGHGREGWHALGAGGGAGAGNIDGRALARSGHTAPPASAAAASAVNGRGVQAGGAAHAANATDTFGAQASKGIGPSHTTAASRQSLPAGLHKISGAKRDRENDNDGRQETAAAQVCESCRGPCRRRALTRSCPRHPEASLRAQRACLWTMVAKEGGGGARRSDGGLRWLTGRGVPGTCKRRHVRGRRRQRLPTAAAWRVSARWSCKVLHPPQ